MPTTIFQQLKTTIPVVFAALLYWMIVVRDRKTYPTVLTNSITRTPILDKVLRRFTALSASWNKGFVPAWLWNDVVWRAKFLRGSLSTIGHHVMRTSIPETPFPVSFNRELFTTTDGGTVGLDWHEPMRKDEPASRYPLISPPADHDCRPIVIIQHGLTGSSESTYVRHVIPKLMSRGFRTVVLVARGCGGLRLTTPFGFTAARTQDMREVVQSLQVRFPNAPLFGVGFSLGAGLLLKYLGEEGTSCGGLSGAVAISPCFDFDKRSPHFDLWSRHRLVHGLKDWAVEHKSTLDHPALNWDRILGSATAREFDSHIVVPVYGYRDVDHYYLDSSPNQYSHAITCPTLALVAKDDPVCSSEGAELLTDKQLGSGLCVVITEAGGHVGYSEGILGKTSWMDDVIVDWLWTCHQNMD